MNNYLNVKWKTETCFSEDCWCKLIVPENSDDKDACIVPSGAIGAEVAEYIVKLHNDNLSKWKNYDADAKFRASLNNAKTIKND